MLLFCTYLAILLTAVIAVASIIFAGTKKQNLYKTTPIFFSFGIFYLISLVYFVEYAPVGLEVLLFYGLMLLSGAFCIASAIVYGCRHKKMRSAKATKTKEPLYALGACLIPFLLLFCSVGRDLFLIRTSDYLVIFESHGNGGIGDYSDYAFAIRGNSCSKIQLGIEYHLDELTPDGTVEVRMGQEDILAQHGITITNGDSDVAKNGKVICKHPGGLINNSFSKGYIVNK